VKYPIILILLFSFSVHATQIDSLRLVTQASLSYQEKYQAYEELSSYYLRKDLDSAKYFIKQFLRLGEVHNDPKFLSRAYKFNAEIFEKEAKYEDAIKYYNKAYQIYQIEKDSFQISETLKFIGRVYSDKGDSKNALKYYLKSDSLKETLNDLRGKASIYNSIGALYYDARNFKEALSYYQKSLNIAEDLQFKYAIGILHMNIGNIYNQLDSVNYWQVDSNLSLSENRKAKAKEHYLISLKISESLHDLQGMSNIYLSLGTVDSLKSIEYLKKSLSIRQDIGDVKGQWEVLKNIAATYFNKNKYKKARVFSEKALSIAIENNLITAEEKSHQQLANIYKKLNEYKLAYQALLDYADLKDSLDNAEKSSEFSKLARKWNYEKEESKNKILQKDKELGEERIAKQRLYLWASGLGLLLFSFLVFFILRGYRQKQKANQLLSKQKEQIEEANEELNQQNEEIVAQRDEIEKQRDIVVGQKEQIEEIHREVSESIDYAKRLQGAILPKQVLLQKSLEDFFVLFMPKDKVSGDFYWWTEVNEQLVVTAADCTGHGVPGAFMSMLGVSFLKEIVNKEYITQPALILKKLRKEIIKTLDQKGVAGEQKDGMDMALVSLNPETKLLQFSGANNPLYIVTKQNILEQIPNAKVFDEEALETKLYEVKPDKMPIAIYEKMDSFTNNEIQLQTGDMIYMFSDGYADQFGGPKGKKFKYKPFKRLLLSNSQKSMSEQMVILKAAFEEWKGVEEQVDDVVVIGLKI